MLLHGGLGQRGWAHNIRSKVSQHENADKSAEKNIGSRQNTEPVKKMQRTASEHNYVPKGLITGAYKAKVWMTIVNETLWSMNEIKSIVFFCKPTIFISQFLLVHLTFQ
jgi:hypothetical protein